MKRNTPVMSVYKCARFSSERKKFDVPLRALLRRGRNNMYILCVLSENNDDNNFRFFFFFSERTRQECDEAVNLN